MTGYKALFRCRLCGETFTTLEAGNGDAALRAALSASAGEVPDPQVPAPALHDIHICARGGIGIADFLGFKEREGDT